MIPMTSAGLSKSLNQRFFLVTRAPAAPPEGRAKRVQGRIFDSDVGLQLRRGAYIQFGGDLGKPGSLPNYKTCLQRCIGL